MRFARSLRTHRRAELERQFQCHREPRSGGLASKQVGGLLANDIVNARTKVSLVDDLGNTGTEKSGLLNGFKIA
jgi:hypothetical protein